MQDLRGFIEASLGLVNRRHAVGHFNGVLHHGLRFFQTLERQVELALLAIDLGNAHVGLGIFWICIGNDLVLLERGVGLTVVHQVLG